MNQNEQFNPGIHHRKAMRLKGYDYSSAGMYFITICTQNRICVFGEIEDERMMYHSAGRIAVDCWEEIPEHFPHAVLHEYIVMPNHVHGIIELKCIEDIYPANTVHRTKTDNSDFNRFQHMVPLSVSSIVKGFKIGVTKRLKYPTDRKEPCSHSNGHQETSVTQSSIWQDRFHDHIIRDEEEYFRISNYIINNPKNWKKDKFYI